MVGMTRRTFFKSALTGLGALGMGGLGAYVEESTMLSVERVLAPISGIRAGLEGLRIAVLSDFHLYPFTRLSFLMQAVGEANRLRPDLTVLLGDFVDQTVDAMDELGPLLGTLQAKIGVFAVLGNHDHRKGASRVAEQLSRQGIEVLANRGVFLEWNGAPFHLAGVDSLSGNFDLRSALSGVREQVPTVLLAHEPDVADAVRQDRRVSVQLSGHSHGGQVRLPGLCRYGLPQGAKKYPFGSYSLDGLFLHTSRGLGTTGAPIRLGSTPEVSEVLLVDSGAMPSRHSGGSGGL
jgi:predicted MPP superfamily phosphohydrolase